MKKLFALLLALVMCLSLTACGDKSPTGNEQGSNPSHDDDNALHAQELTDILCAAEWHCRDWDSVLYFSADGTVRFHYSKNEEDGNYAWQYSSYLNSFSEYQAILQHDPEFSDSYGVYIGSMDRYGQILLGRNDDGSYKMYFNGKFWDPVTEDNSTQAALYLPYVGKWVCDENYWVVVNADGTLIYNGDTFTPEYIQIYGGIGAVVPEASYSYRGGTEIYTNKGCVFVWGLTDRFGDGVMVGDHDGRQFILQGE